jgi:hypothetical protein
MLSWKTAFFIVRFKHAQVCFKWAKLVTNKNSYL